jgi:hypothetical protein
LNSLGTLLSNRDEHANTPHDRERALHCFRECVALHSAAPTCRLDAASRVTSILYEDRNWVHANEFGEITVDLLARISSRSLCLLDL